MKILMNSVPFWPSVGGIETVTAVLASELHAAGHPVRLMTQTPADVPDSAPFEVLRVPTARQCWQAHRWADVVLHNNISLRAAWPPLIDRSRPWVIAHHIWTPRSGVGRLKHLVMPAATHIAVSRAIAASVDVPTTVIGNPYDDALFRLDPAVARSRELVFLGRLVSDKGIDVLLDALAELRQRGRDLMLTVIGTGPEEAALRARALRLGVATQVRFAGILRGAALVEALNAHQLLVVPSVWEEPFGVVALEGLACGLLPVVTRSGGLPDAVGGCGLVVAKGSPTALADGIERALTDEDLRAALRAAAPAHLAAHSPQGVARSYLRVLEAALARAR